ncbi:lipopolysaccharide assembly protein LapB [Bacillus cereus group sp. BfR-BA-01380]|uniref:tetratricopeptide repeat protein n=1 Tax=Bacillus cereus group sp. BfR-BA-01380 TaxID=2920324 RepID=UPI001F58EE43|nr:hypothetical protein [Bacillus cereus group sp. BfR-BA-01380]
MEDNFRRIQHLVKVGDAERAMEEAEMLIEEDPEDASGYLCLSYVYFYGFGDNDNANKYLEEALKLDHLNDFVLWLGLEIFSEQQNLERLEELAEIGIKNYPEDGKYYFYMGEVVRCREDIKDSLVYFEKAMELDPENEVYVGRYAYVLSTSFPKRKEEALKAEKRALELNPENTFNLVMFANIAKHKGNFKKARMLAEVAMRLDPNDIGVYKIYKSMIGTKNKFCAFTTGFSHVVGQAFVRFCSLFKFLHPKYPKIAYSLCLLSLLGWLILPVYATGWYAGSVYIGILVMYFISSRIKKKIYKEVGLGTSFDAKENLRENQFTRKQEISKMARTLEKVEPAVVSTPKLSQEEMESQMASFWSTGAVFEKQPIEEVAAATQPQLSSKEHKEIQSYSNIESPRYNRWQIYLIVTLSLTLVFRAGKVYNLYHKEDKNPMPNISLEEKKAITKSADNIPLKKLPDISMPMAELTLHSLKTSDFSENSLRQDVSDQYVPIVMGKAGQPSVEKLKNSHPAKFYKEEENKYLLVKSDDSTFILEIIGNKINHIYGEIWDNSEQEMQRYNELLNKLETKGVEAKGKKD